MNQTMSWRLTIAVALLISSAAVQIVRAQDAFEEVDPADANSPLDTPRVRVMFKLTPQRCTLSGDIFGRHLTDKLRACYLKCRGEWLGFPADCAWQAEFLNASVARSQSLSEEQRALFVAAFGEIDVDRNGELNAAELQRHLSTDFAVDVSGHLHLPLRLTNDAERRRFTTGFERLDKDSSGGVSMSEYIHAVHWYPEFTRRRAIETVYLTLSNLAWLPALYYVVKNRLLVEPFAVSSFILFVSVFHLCKDGAVCLARYDFLFFLDAFCATAGVLLAFMQSSALYGRFRDIAGVVAMLFGCLYGYRTMVHRDPRELNIYRVFMFAIGLSLPVIRYGILDRKLPNFNWRQVGVGWVVLLTGLIFMALVQQYLSYWIVHGSWHALAALAGYLIITATFPAGFLPTWHDVLGQSAPRRRKAHPY